jgi:hypothetical protein
MQLFEHKKYSDFLEKLADSLDLTESQYLFAKEKYEALSNYLNEPNSLLSKYTPNILLQGSIKLGTAVRPVVEDDEFDVDITCRLHCQYPAKQIDLKSLIHKRLCQDSTYESMLDKEKQRCWRLKYPEKHKFHLDLVPAYQDNYQWLIEQGVPLSFAEHAICITDKENNYYEQLVFSNRWPKSNTEGYAQWFLGVMKIQADKIKEELKTQLLLERIEDIPDYKVRTPLQRGIQLMKRHRDIMFREKEDKPISIIITTLAALAYENVLENPKSMMFYDIIMEMVEKMPSFITRPNGLWHIKNPVDPKENFADKWNVEPSKAKDYQEWYEGFKLDFKQSFTKGDIQSAIDFLKPKFGNRAINEANERINEKVTLTETFANKSQPSHIQSPMWPLRLIYSIRINCKCKYPGGWDWMDIQKPELPKNCELIFAASTNITAPYDVFWQVVNTGKEAEEANDLRGSIFKATTAGIGGLQRKEHSKYLGRHWIECFIVKDGVCVARSKEFYVTVR